MLTPVDIKNHGFRTTGLGNNKSYPKTEVDSFMDQIYDSYEATSKELSDLKAQNAQLTLDSKKFNEMQTGLVTALANAETQASAKIADAQAKADQIIAEAEAKANERLTSANAAADNIDATVQEKIQSATADAMKEKDEIIAKANADVVTIKAEAEKMHAEASEAKVKADAEAATIVAGANSQKESILAEANSKSAELVSNAQAEADKILKDAQIKSDSMLEVKTKELEDLTNQAKKLEEVCEAYKKQATELFEKQLESIKSGSLDVTVHDFSATVSAAEEILAKNASNIATNKERLNAFDAEQEDLDADGLNASGLNFDVERSTTGIIVEDFEMNDNKAEVAEDTTKEAPVTPAADDDIVIAGANSSTYDDFSSAPSFDNGLDNDSPFTFTDANN
ncbi:MAG: DivIVA domain-containing protein [Lachnospiraceae bacterium]|nr:DivIVA domain-containing protein [Lachnospiraceae bacterium]